MYWRCYVVRLCVFRVSITKPLLAQSVPAHSVCVAYLPARSACLSSSQGARQPTSISHITGQLHEQFLRLFCDKVKAAKPGVA